MDEAAQKGTSHTSPQNTGKLIMREHAQRVVGIDFTLCLASEERGDYAGASIRESEVEHPLSN